MATTQQATDGCLMRMRIGSRVTTSDFEPYYNKHLFSRISFIRTYEIRVWP